MPRRPEAHPDRHYHPRHFRKRSRTEPLPRETYGRPADRGIAGLRLAAKSPPSLAAMVSRWEAGEAEIYLLTPRPDVLARGE